MFPTVKYVICFCATLIFSGAVYLETTVAAAPQQSEPVVVKMTAEHKFMPDKITIKAGQAVQWVNEDKEMPHEVTTDPDAANDPSDVSIPDGAKPFDSHLLVSGKSFRQQFTVPGLYRYACPPHENDGMLGQVTVTK